MTLNKCPLEFIKENEKFFVLNQEDSERGRTELVNGDFIKNADGSVYQVIIENGHLSIMEVSYPEGVLVAGTLDTYNYKVHDVEITVSKPQNGLSKVKIGLEEHLYFFNKKDQKALDLPNDCYIKLQSVYQQPTRIILFQKLSTNLPQS